MSFHERSDSIHKLSFREEEELDQNPEYEDLKEKNEADETHKDTIDLKRSEEQQQSIQKKDAGIRDIRMLSMYVVNFLLTANYSNVGPFFPDMAKTKDVSSTWVGAIFAIHAAGVLVISFLLGKKMRFWGRKRLIIIGTILQILTSVGIACLKYINGAATFIAVAMVVRFLQGAGRSFYATSSYAIVPILYPDSVQSKIGGLEALTGLGFMVGPFIGAGLFELGGYVAPFFTFAGLFAISLPLSWYSIPSDEILDKEVQKLVEKLGGPQKLQKKQLPVSKFIFNRKILATYIVFSMCSINIAYLGPILVGHMSTFGVSPSQTGMIYVFGSLGYIVTIKIITMYLVKKVDRKILIIIGIVIAMVSQILVGPEPHLFEHWLVLNIVGQFLYGPSNAFQYIPMIPELIMLGKEVFVNDNEGVGDLAAGTFQAGVALGQGIGPLLGGFLQDNLDFYKAANIIMAMDFLSLLTYLIFGDGLITIFKSCCPKRKKIDEKEPLISSEHKA